jgi:hypothetical protein
MPSLDASTYLLVAGFGLAIYVMLRGRRLSEPEPTRRPFASVGPLIERARHSVEPPLELLRWQVEMHDTAKELKAELDSKLSALQALVIMARGESERLEAAIRKAEALDLPTATGSLAILERLGEPAALEDPHALCEAADRVGSKPVLADPFAGEQTDLSLANLAAKGLASQEIARRLNLPLGEVELRLNLIAR